MDREELFDGIFTQLQMLRDRADSITRKVFGSVDLDVIIDEAIRYAKLNVKLKPTYELALACKKPGELEAALESLFKVRELRSLAKDLVLERADTGMLQAFTDEQAPGYKQLQKELKGLLYLDSNNIDTGSLEACFTAYPTFLRTAIHQAGYFQSKTKLESETKLFRYCMRKRYDVLDDIIVGMSMDTPLSPAADKIKAWVLEDPSRLQDVFYCPDDVLKGESRKKIELLTPYLKTYGQMQGIAETVERMGNKVKNIKKA